MKQTQKIRKAAPAGGLPAVPPRIYDVPEMRRLDRATRNQAWVRERIAARGWTDDVELLARLAAYGGFTTWRAAAAAAGLKAS